MCSTRRTTTRTSVLAAVLLVTGAVSAVLGTSSASAATSATLGYDLTDLGSTEQAATMIGAASQWSAGNTGAGVDVALIDTGVAAVKGLTGNVINGPDLSFDGQTDSTRYIDGFGHGTHMASLIAGRDGDGSSASTAVATNFNGMAPGSRVISLKVGASEGIADVTQVIAAVNWVTQHAHDPGLNIRVLNLSYGTSSTQDYRSDPLAFAVEAAWRKGIFVVVAGGNDGSARPFLANPALNPNIFAVGASDAGTTVVTADDTVPAFSQRGNDQRHVDVVAPGTHLIGLRAPNGFVDTTYPSSRVGTRFTRGSGTSQAAAVASGAAALLLAKRPALTPDQAKWLLLKTVTVLPRTTATTAGAGMINVDAAARYTGAVPAQSTLTATTQYGAGTGSIEATRGSGHIVVDGTQLVGEKDIFGRNWTPSTWAQGTLAGTSWTGGTYSDNVWSGTQWTTGTAYATGASWSGRSWIGSSWTGRSWISGDWKSRSWLDTTWAGRSWVSGIWADAAWS